MKTIKQGYITRVISEPCDSLISYAEAAYEKDGDKEHLKIVKKLENSNRKLAISNAS